MAEKDFFGTHFEEYISGNSIDAYHYFGSKTESGGVRFTLYAPNAASVAVAGDFIQWAEDSHIMNRKRVNLKE